MCLTASAQTTIEPRYTADGQLTRPDNYREWIYLSSGLGMTYGPAKLPAGSASPSTFHPRNFSKHFPQKYAASGPDSVLT